MDSIEARRNEARAQDGDDVAGHGITENANETVVDDVEAHGLLPNSNETVVEDDPTAVSTDEDVVFRSGM